MDSAVRQLAQQCLTDDRGIVSFVGGGGKTTALFLLARYLRQRGIDTAVSTTTHFHVPPWADREIPVYGIPQGHKLAAPPDLKEIAAAHRVLLLEADGACRHPFKAPAGHEPVLVPGTTHVVAVAGLSAIGQSIAAAGFRIDRLCRLLNCSPEHILTPEDLAAVLLHPRGGRKGAEHLPFSLLLNQADTPHLRRAAAVIARIAEEQEVPSVTASLLMERSCCADA